MLKIKLTIVRVESFLKEEYILRTNVTLYLVEYIPYEASDYLRREAEYVRNSQKTG